MPLLVLHLATTTGCELYLRRDFSVQVIDSKTKLPSPNVEIEALYVETNIFASRPVKAVTDEDGRTLINMPDTDAIVLDVGNQMLVDLPDSARKHGAWLGDSREDEYLVWIKRGSSEMPDSLPHDE